MRYFIPVFFFTALFFASCKNEKRPSELAIEPTILHHANLTLLETVMEDALPPPVASRAYVYPHIAHYITLNSFYPDSLVNITDKLNDLGELNLPDSKNSHPELSALYAFTNIAQKVVFSEHYIEELRDTITNIVKDLKITEDVIDASNQYAKTITDQLAKWIDQDNYIETRTFDRWTSTKLPHNWRETPPDYETGLEPHWDKIRPLLLDTVGGFVPKALPKFSTDPNSDFYKMVLQVYEQILNSKPEYEDTAWFWDCNPIGTVHQGHMVMVIQKFTPPGHWLNIVNQVAESENASYLKSTKAYTYTAISMFDALIDAWHLKYKTDLVRPVTYIQEYIDPHWAPVIQTPPFPEYTSGHSATSASAAGVLTEIFGENISFTDRTQLRYGLKERTFNSFKEAARQVDSSRYYGGIHYMIGVNEGSRQGYYVAENVLKKLMN
ncbi:MAG: vanadium-dependent haloperoxidase [Flavobacteriaceae bacterium]